MKRPVGERRDERRDNNASLTRFVLDLTVFVTINIFECPSLPTLKSDDPTYNLQLYTFILSYHLKPTTLLFQVGNV